MKPAESPLSFKAHVARLPQNGMPLTFEATEKEGKALAEAHGLLDVASFKVDLLVTRWRGDGVKISGTLKAHVTQQCVVTLEPLEADIETDVDGLFVPENSKLARIPTGERGEVVVHADSADLPEPFTGDTIDVGALAEEFFELALDPYPRKAGAEFAAPSAFDAAEEKRESPFAGLSALKRRDDSGK